MGQLTLPPTGPIYVDTGAVIRAVERLEPWYSAELPLWQALHAGRQRIVTSELTLLEVSVKPLRNADQTLWALYRTVLLATAGLSCIPIDLVLLNVAANLRAHQKLKTPDAIHAATAIETNCTMFVTNDVGFRRVPSLNVVVLDEIVASP